MATVQKIGKYEIQAELGQGGFGRVYRAFDPTVGRPVAIKVLTTEGNKGLLSRFRNEATAAGNLRHKNIVTIYEFGEYNGRPFLVMELLEGEDLLQVISSGRQLTLLQKMHIMAQVADGLHCAHASGVIHRDVKPANIRLLPDGTVKIMDFGIARLTRERDATRLTQRGDLVGTILYMSPEQFSGAEADALCDIFAYGVTYYELMTGKHPFRSADARAVMFKITTEDPEPVRAFATECPEALENIISRAMQKDRELRYQTLRDLQFDAEPLLIQLQQERAVQLLEDAMRLFESKELKAAMPIVVQVLNLDPNNREARRLRESIQKQMQKDLFQPRIDALLKDAEQQLAQRQFAETIQSLDSALRLDRTNVSIRTRLEQAQTQLAHCRKAARLAADARSSVGRGDLPGAVDAASKALNLDPHNAEARRVLDIVRAEEKRFEEALATALELLECKRIDEAIAALELLQALQPESSEVKAALKTAGQQKIERERQERLRARMAAVSDLMEQGKPAEGVEQLYALQNEFPQNPEVQSMLARAEEQLQAQLHAQAIERAVTAAQIHLDAHDFAAALACVETALQRYPHEVQLTLFAEWIRGSQAASERERAVRQTAETCAELRHQNRIPQALQFVASVLRKYPGQAQLLALQQELTSELAALDRAEEINKAAAESEELIRQDRSADAVRLLENACSRFAHEPALQSALSRAVQIRSRVEALAAIREEARKLSQTREFDAAISVIVRGLKEWPDETALAALFQQALSERREFKREHFIEETGRRCEELIGAHRLSEALELIATSLGRYPQQPHLLALRKRAVLAAVNEAGALVGRAEPEKAIELLRAVEGQGDAQDQVCDLLARAAEQIHARELKSSLPKSG